MLLALVDSIDVHIEGRLLVHLGQLISGLSAVMLCALSLMVAVTRSLASPEYLTEMHLFWVLVLNWLGDINLGNRLELLRFGGEYFITWKEKAMEALAWEDKVDPSISTVPSTSVVPEGPTVAPVPFGEQMSQIQRTSGDVVRKRRVIGVVEEEKLEIYVFAGDMISIDSETLAPASFERARFLVETDWDSYIDERIELQLDVESILDREAKVPTGKVEEPLEVQEVGGSSRVEGRLSDASMEGTVVPNIASLDVDPANHLDRMLEGNMREDWRVLEVSSLSRNWSNKEEASIVNRLDGSHLGVDGLKEVFVPVNEVLEGIGDIASLGVLSA
ncbi:hypothetical protein V6N11_055305 [Hibiscus sabdariffa]|uniref:Uncharacterized protein n=1 Tax=Hibiscus sabdariffa TaxID=183260 RepID=A0ABR2PFC5_9ROSI